MWSTTIVTLTERKSRDIARLMAGFEQAKTALAFYAAEHGGRFVVFGSFGARSGSPRQRLRRNGGLSGCSRPRSSRCRRGYPSRQRAQARCAPPRRGYRGLDAPHRPGWGVAAVMDARWLDVEDDVAAASSHFANAVKLPARGGFDAVDLDGYRNGMALMHALQSGPVRTPRSP